jgi:tmRNA-binding protein
MEGTNIHDTYIFVANSEAHITMTQINKLTISYATKFRHKTNKHILIIHSNCSRKEVTCELSITTIKLNI